MFIRRLTLIALIFAVNVSWGGPTFFQQHRTRTRCQIPGYDYRSSGATVAATTTSEAAIPRFAEANGAVINANGAPVQIGCNYVLGDTTAGPLTLTDTAAWGTGREAAVTGIITHSGGDVGQLAGGKAVIRVELLQKVGTVSGNTPVLTCREFTCWVRKGESETVQMCLELPAHASIQDVDRVRLYLEYHPNR